MLFLRKKCYFPKCKSNHLWCHFGLNSSAVDKGSLIAQIVEKLIVTGADEIDLLGIQYELHHVQIYQTFLQKKEDVAWNVADSYHAKDQSIA